MLHFSNRLRATRSAAVEQQESSGDAMSEYLGYEGQDFKFEHLECEVTLKGCSVENGEISSITEWIADLS
jgi:signal recognition particle receptor subunit beta